VPLTHLFGREEEIAHIVDFMDDEGVRLLTLTGPGGIGKTRLAIEVVNRLAPDFAHGACFRA
jgi:predicted ATPase